MPIYDNEILKANINKLRNDSGLNQEAFAKKAGVSQSRLSKLLGNDEGARFSIEQIFNIASAFNVSIDYLVTGKEPEPINSTRDVCEVLVMLFDNYYIEHQVINREEEVHTPVYYGNLPDCEHTKEKVNYNALFFANYWYPDPNRDYTEDEMDELRAEAYQVGNDLQMNISINRFLSAYIPIHELHSAGKMPDDAYKYTVNSLLDSIK